MNKLPSIKELAGLIRAIKPYIEDDYIAEDDTLPSIQITVGWNPGTGEWAHQTGDNSYTGSAYFYPIWGIATIYRRSDSRALARDIVGQLSDQDFTSGDDNAN